MFQGEGGRTDSMVTTLRIALVLMVTLSLGVAPLTANADAESDTEAGRLSPYWGGAISQWSPWIIYWADDRGLDPDLVAAVIRKESIGRANAEGPYGAVGLMMVMPAETSGLSWRPSAEELKQPNVNLRWGTGMLKQIVRDSGGDLSRALAAYNGGWEQVHLTATKKYAQSVLTFYAYAIAGRHGYSYQESKIWSLVVVTRVDGHIQLIQTLSSGHFLVPCFGSESEFQEVFPDVDSALHTRAAHFTDKQGHDVLIEAWLFVGDPDTPAGETVVSTTPPEISRVERRP